MFIWLMGFRCDGCAGGVAVSATSKLDLVATPARATVPAPVLPLRYFSTCFALALAFAGFGVALGAGLPASLAFVRLAASACRRACSSSCALVFSAVCAIGCLLRISGTPTTGVPGIVDCPSRGLAVLTSCGCMTRWLYAAPCSSARKGFRSGRCCAESEPLGSSSVRRPASSCRRPATRSCQVTRWPRSRS